MLNFTLGRESDILLLRGELVRPIKYSLSDSNGDGLEAGLPYQSEGLAL